MTVTPSRSYGSPYTRETVIVSRSELTSSGNLMYVSLIEGPCARLCEEDGGELARSARGRGRGRPTHEVRRPGAGTVAFSSPQPAIGVLDDEALVARPRVA